MIDALKKVEAIFLSKDPFSFLWWNFCRFPWICGIWKVVDRDLSPFYYFKNWGKGLFVCIICEKSFIEWINGKSKSPTAAFLKYINTYRQLQLMGKWSLVILTSETLFLSNVSLRWGSNPAFWNGLLSPSMFTRVIIVLNVWLSSSLTGRFRLSSLLQQVFDNRTLM